MILMLFTVDLWDTKLVSCCWCAPDCGVVVFRVNRRFRVPTAARLAAFCDQWVRSKSSLAAREPLSGFVTRTTTFRCVCISHLWWGFTSLFELCAFCSFTQQSPCFLVVFFVFFSPHLSRRCVHTDILHPSLSCNGFLHKINVSTEYLPDRQAHLCSVQVLFAHFNILQHQCRYLFK